MRLDILVRSFAAEDSTTTAGTNTTTFADTMAALSQHRALIDILRTELDTLKHQVSNPTYQTTSNNKNRHKNRTEVAPHQHAMSISEQSDRRDCAGPGLGSKVQENNHSPGSFGEILNTWSNLAAYSVGTTSSKISCMNILYKPFRSRSF